MAWTSRGLRGSTLEEMINRTNEQYRDKHLALIQKVPTPITPIKIDKESRHITLAYFEKKSTVDYIGAVQGIPVCFDAKECKTDSFPLANIHEHQVTFMKDFEQQGGISFLLLYFTARDEYYYLRYETMKTFWDRGQNGGKKHFSYTELETSFFLPRTHVVDPPVLPGRGDADHTARLARIGQHADLLFGDGDVFVNDRSALRRLRAGGSPCQEEHDGRIFK